MCGITGQVFEDPSAKDPDGFDQAFAAIQARGPDDSGVYQNESVLLGHRRLSIIDVANNTQPLESKCGRYVMIYNGEIYNYIELNDVLVKKGVVLDKVNDTAVLLELFALEGEKCLKRLNGMFAFAIWDVVEKKLFAARDRLGEKPLFYAHSNGTFCFSSTVASLVRYKSISSKLNPHSVREYFSHQFIKTSSIYADVKKLDPGSLLTFDFKEGLNFKVYWGIDPEQNQADSPSSEELKELIDDAITIRLRSDVAVGVFLSGGVDSSIITSVASKAIEGVSTFCAGFDSDSFDESGLAKRSAERYGTNHKEFKISDSPDQLVDTIRDIISVIGEPFADPSIVPFWKLCKQTSNHLKVVLSGDGADEVFGGYRRYYAANYSRFIYRYRWLSKVFYTTTRWLNTDGTYFAHSLPKKLSLLGDYVHERSLNKEMRTPVHFLARELDELLKTGKNEVLEDTLDLKDTLSEIQKCQIDDIYNYLPDDILVKTDRISMHFGLETRAPFLDHRVVQAGVGLPDSDKISPKNQKILLKDTYKEALIDDVYNSPKHGFVSPLYAWLLGPLRGIVEEMLSDASMSEFVNLETLKTLWTIHLSGKKDNSQKLWIALVFFIWLKEVYQK